MNISELRKHRNSLGLCADCGINKTASKRKRCWECLSKSKEKTRIARLNPEYNVKYNRNMKRVRKETIDHYGGKCICCGETTYEFLVFDHINNDGAKQREEWFGTNKGCSGNRVYYKLRQLGYPEDIQILCYNCNCAKAYYGICPHQRDK